MKNYEKIIRALQQYDDADLERILKMVETPEAFKTIEERRRESINSFLVGVKDETLNSLSDKQYSYIENRAYHLYENDRNRMEAEEFYIMDAINKALYEYKNRVQIF